MPFQHSYNLIGGATLDQANTPSSFYRGEQSGPTWFRGRTRAKTSGDGRACARCRTAQTTQDSRRLQLQHEVSDRGLAQRRTRLLLRVTSSRSARTNRWWPLASTNAYAAGSYGDAMMGIHVDGANAGNAQSQWSVTDLWKGAELRSPMFQPRLLSQRFPPDHERSPSMRRSFRGAPTQTGQRTVWSIASAHARSSSSCEADSGLAGSAPPPGPSTIGGAHWHRQQYGQRPTSPTARSLGEGRFTVPEDHNGNRQYSSENPEFKAMAATRQAGLSMRVCSRRRRHAAGSMGVQGFAKVNRSASDRSHELPCGEPRRPLPR